MLITNIADKKGDENGMKKTKCDPETEKFFKEWDKLVKDIDRTNKKFKKDSDATKKKFEAIAKRWNKHGI